jgi:DNA gyrase subunit A
MQVITVTASGLAKRTSRHLYNRQRRGGMGIFDIESDENDPPALLTIADEGQHLLAITNYGRAFRLPVNAIPSKAIRARGESIVQKWLFGDDERLAALLTDQAQGYIALLSQSGMVRLLRHHVFGEHMRPGTFLFDYKQFGPLASACRSDGDGDLFIATRLGKAIRFSEKSLPPQGALGIRLSAKDQAVAIAAVKETSSVFLLSSDGKGAIRSMESFSANKAPGAAGKIAKSGDPIVSALCTDDQEDLFIISNLAKIIRFRLEEVPAKEGVVQGVICMTLRADTPIAACTSPGISVF